MHNPTEVYAAPVIGPLPATGRSGLFHLLAARRALSAEMKENKE